MLRSFAHSTPWMTRLARLHAFLARHCSQYAQSCLAVHPPTSLLNLSALNDTSDASQPFIAVEYFDNLLTSADGIAIQYNTMENLHSKTDKQTASLI